MAAAVVTEPSLGLDDAEAARRTAAGQANTDDEGTSRTVAAIVRANVVTRFNALLGSLLVVILIVGPPQDALFGIVLVSNTVIGVVQEIRAKRTLDRLVVIGGTTSTVIRSGRAQTVPFSAVVVGDLVELRRGDQVVVDGPVVSADGLEVDESLLTGESVPVAKHPGAELRSGSWVVAGTGTQEAVCVGGDAYGRRLAREGRRFVLTRSELRAGIDTILRGVTWVLVPTSILLVFSQLAQSSDLHESIRASVAGVVNMVPEGLVLLTSTALAIGVVRLGRRRVLVQELSALEGLARVDVLCLDKTGTLTEGQIELVAVEAVDDVDVDAILAGFAATDPDPNATLLAVTRSRGSQEPWPIRWRVPFSSASRWSAIASGDTAWALGAPDVLLPWSAPQHEPNAAAARDRVDRLIGAGRRVLVLGSFPAASDPGAPIGSLRPLAVVAFGETVRADARTTTEWFKEQGVRLKVLSGDEPSTIAAVAHEVDIADDLVAVDARELPADADALAREVERGDVFGRVDPDQKRTIIAALQSCGHTVGMIGDGVNDVLALKQADLGVAMASGSSAARSAAQIVMLDSGFAGLPALVDEGRRVTGNVERVAKLFVTKTVYACLLAIAVGVARLPFPFFPRHLTLVSSLTIGIPAFVLALVPNRSRVATRFTRRVLTTAVPLGAVAAVATFAGYALARDDDLPPNQARTVATLVLFGVGIWVLAVVARPLTTGRRALIVAMVATFAVVASTPSLRSSFGLELPRPLVFMAVVGIVLLAGTVMEQAGRLLSRQ